MSEGVPEPQHHVAALLRRHLPTLLAFVPLAIVEVALDAGLTLSYRYIVDHARTPGSERTLILLVVALAIGVLVVSLVSTFRDHVYARQCARMMNDVRGALFDHCQRLSVSFYGTHSSGDVVSRFSTDLGSLEYWVTGAMTALIIPTLGVLTGVGLLFYLLDWKLALTATMVWPLVLIVPHFIAPRAALAGYDKKREDATTLGAVQEMVDASQVIKVYGLEAHSRARFEHLLTRLARTATRGAFLGSLVERTTVVTIYGMQVLAVAMAAWLAHTGRVTIGSLVSFLTIFWNIGWSLVAIGRFAPGMVAAASSMRRIDELLSEPTDANAASGLIELAPLSRSIRFDDVTFSYRAGEPVLRGVTFEIHHGQRRPDRGGKEHGAQSPRALS